MKIMVKCDYLELWMQPELNNKNNAGIGTFIGQKCPKFRMFTLPALFFKFCTHQSRYLPSGKQIRLFNYLTKKYRNQFKSVVGFCIFLHCHEVDDKFNTHNWRTKDPLAVHLKFRHLKICLIFDIAIHLMLRCSCFLTLRKV